MMSREEKNKKAQLQIEKAEKKKVINKNLVKFFTIFMIILIIIFSFLFYMRYFGTSGLKVKEYKVVNSKLPSSFHGFKIVQFSDLHYNSTFGYEELKNLVNEIKLLKPDIIVFTGDLTDQYVSITDDDINNMVSLFNEMEASVGLYAVRGNHDYGTSYFDDVFFKTKFNVLDNDYDLIYYLDSTPILINGIGSGIENDIDLENTFRYEDRSLFTVTLLHEPDDLDKILKENEVDLALGGHSHNGQVRIPFLKPIIKMEGAKKYDDAYYKVNNTDLYVSGGLGTSMFKLRWFNKPSINLYRLVTE
ncbi:MAG: hypothetical protein E7168_04760 [Firmicutes bacterium]|nr:hypothetical protein [Bacillota bacterium]